MSDTIADAVCLLRDHLVAFPIDATTTSLFDELMDAQDDLDDDDPLHERINSLRRLYNAVGCVRLCYRNYITEPTDANRVTLQTFLSNDVTDAHVRLSDCKTYKDVMAAMYPVGATG